MFAHCGCAPLIFISLPSSALALLSSSAVALTARSTPHPSNFAFLVSFFACDSQGQTNTNPYLRLRDCNCKCLGLALLRPLDTSHQVPATVLLCSLYDRRAILHRCSAAKYDHRASYPTSHFQQYFLHLDVDLSALCFNFFTSK